MKRVPPDHLGVRPQSTKDAERWSHIHSVWKNCKDCPVISACAYKKVFGRGDLPCDWVLVGEGPGKAEDVMGEPFVGNAGKLLQKSLEDSGAFLDFELRFFITNLVLCRPTDFLGGPNRQPMEKEVANCAPRLAATINLARPTQGVILLGRIPSCYFPEHIAPKLDKSLANIKIRNHLHPAALLRSGGEKSGGYARYVETFTKFFTEGQ